MWSEGILIGRGLDLKGLGRLIAKDGMEFIQCGFLMDKSFIFEGKFEGKNLYIVYIDMF